MHCWYEIDQQHWCSAWNPGIKQEKCFVFTNQAGTFIVIHGTSKIVPLSSPIISSLWFVPPLNIFPFFPTVPKEEWKVPALCTLKAEERAVLSSCWFSITRHTSTGHKEIYSHPYFPLKRKKRKNTFHHFWLTRMYINNFFSPFFYESFAKVILIFLWGPTYTIWQHFLMCLSF